MTLNHLLQNVRTRDITGNTAVEIGAIRFDSRLVRPGDVFVAVRGAQADGHAFIDKAIEKGAAAIVCENRGDAEGFQKRPDLTVVQVADSAEALGQMASAYFGNPSNELCLVGVTGTNGKTTVVTLLWQLFTRLGHTCGLIGTIENRIGNQAVVLVDQRLQMAARLFAENVVQGGRRSSGRRCVDGRRRFGRDGGHVRAFRRSGFRGGFRR